MPKRPEMLAVLVTRAMPPILVPELYITETGVIQKDKGRARRSRL